MAPTRYVQGNRPTQGPAGDGHALAARDSDSAVQSHGTSSYDDGYYHPSIYHAGEKNQVEADDGSYPPKKKDSTTRQDSSLATAEQGSWGRQQAQGYQSDAHGGPQYSGSQYGTSLGSGSQNSGSRYSGSQYAGSQIPNSQNPGPQSGAHSGSETGSQSGSYNAGAYQQSSNAQNAGQPQSHHVASNSSYPHIGQGVAAQQKANSDTATNDAHEQSSWSQQSAQGSQPKPKEPSPQSQGTPANANHEGPSHQNNDNQVAEESHEQENNRAESSGAHVSEEHQVNSAEENEPHNLVNNHVAPAATVQTVQQPTHTLPWLTTGTVGPTSSLTTTAATTDSTHTSLPTTSSTSSATSTPTPGSAKDSDDASYHKATGALAGLLGVAFVAGFVIFWFARRKRQQKTESNRSKMVRDAFRQSCANTKQRTSKFYTNLLGSAVGTGASALGAVRRSIAMPKFSHRREKSDKEPMPQEGHIHHPCDDGNYVRGQDLDDSSGHDSDRNDSIAAEKAAINESTPTLVVSPSESIARDQTPTVRRVISGRPQMESSESVEPKSGLSHNSQDSEPEPNDKANEDRPSTPLPASKKPSPDNGAQHTGAQANSAQYNGAQPTGAQANSAQPTAAQANSAQDNDAQANSVQENGAEHTGAQANSAQDNGAQPTGAQANSAQANSAQANSAQDNDAQANSVQENGAEHTGAQANSAQDNGAQPTGAQANSAQANGVQHTGAQANSAQPTAAQANSAQDNDAQANSVQENGAEHTGAQANSAQDKGAQPTGAQANSAQANGVQHTGAQENAAQENGPPPRNGNGQNLLAITSMVPSSTSVYRVEIAFQPKKVGQLDLREGQSIIIRQTFDDGWVLCTPADGGQEGLAPRACLSPWPIKNAASTSSSNYNLSDGARTPESPTAPGTPRFYSHFYSTRSVTQ